MAGVARIKKRARRYHHHVYPARPCVYVGMTGLDPDERFDKHKAGIKSNRFVRVYGLREQGYGVWQA